MSLQERRNRKHLARAERERLMRRNVFIGVGVVALLLLGILGYGIYDTNIRQPNLPAVTVNGDEIPQGLFRARVVLAQAELLGRYQNTRSIMNLVGDSPEAMASLQQELTNLQEQLDDPSLIGQQVMEQLIQDLLVRQEAEERGIAVAESEIDDAVQELFGFFPKGTPTPLPSSTPLPTATREAGAEQTATATVTASPTPSPTSDPTSTPLPSPTPHTIQLFEENYQRYMQDLAASEISEEHFRYFVESDIFRRKLRQDIASEVPREQEQVKARHILVDEESTAQEVLERLETGDEWASLAVEYSTDSANRNRGGDLGWFGRGRMVEAFEEAAFTGVVGEIVGPVESPFGFHLIEILGHETRELAGSAYDSAISSSFNQWLQEARGIAELDVLETWPELLPTVEPYVTGGF
jgi:parvulin-like peptidyl-prolyl isomerase